jgi:outer membrane protein TolC
MNKITCLVLLILACSVTCAQQTFNLDEIIERAKSQSPAAKQAETRKENRYWFYRNYRANYNPQLRLAGQLPNYYKSVNQISQQDGTYRYIPVEQTNNSINLGLVQPITLTGGTISANSSLGYFKDYTDESAFNEQWSGSVMNIALSQPLFSFNRLRWDRKIEPLRYEESKREYVERRGKSFFQCSRSSDQPANRTVQSC